MEYDLYVSDTNVDMILEHTCYGPRRFMLRWKIAAGP